MILCRRLYNMFHSLKLFLLILAFVHFCQVFNGYSFFFTFSWYKYKNWVWWSFTNSFAGLEVYLWLLGQPMILFVTWPEILTTNFQSRSIVIILFRTWLQILWVRVTFLLNNIFALFPRKIASLVVDKHCYVGSYWLTSFKYRSTQIETQGYHDCD